MFKAHGKGSTDWRAFGKVESTKWEAWLTMKGELYEEAIYWLWDFAPEQMKGGC